MVDLYFVSQDFGRSFRCNVRIKKAKCRAGVRNVSRAS